MSVAGEHARTGPPSPARKLEFGVSDRLEMWRPLLPLLLIAFVYSALSNPELMRPSDITPPWANQAGRRLERRLKPSGCFSPKSQLSNLVNDGL